VAVAAAAALAARRVVVDRDAIADPHPAHVRADFDDLAGRGGPDLPLEVSAIDSIPAATDAPERSLRIVAHQSVSLLHIRDGDAVSCEVLDRCLDVSRYLLECAGDWLG
jgi:hypothetical protein